MSDPTVQPYGMSVPLYQAFLAYCEMGEEMRDEIVRTSNLRLQSVDPVVKATCATLADAFEAKRVGAQLEMLRSQAQSKAVYSEIENFLNEFTKDLYNFMILYGLN